MMLMELESQATEAIQFPDDRLPTSIHCDELKDRLLAMEQDMHCIACKAGQSARRKIVGVTNTADVADALTQQMESIMQIVYNVSKLETSMKKAPT